MGSAWRPELYDMAAWTAFQVEEVDISLDFEEMLEDDDACLAWERDYRNARKNPRLHVQRNQIPSIHRYPFHRLCST
jgi:hypothetical protein